MIKRPVITPQLDGYAKQTLMVQGFSTSYIDGYAVDGYTTSNSFQTEAISLVETIGYSVSVSCPSTGSPNGTFKLQGCNDDETSEAGLVNWFDVASGGNRIVSSAISGAKTDQLTDPQACYRWMRIVYTRSSGAITATIRIQPKQDQ